MANAAILYGTLERIRWSVEKRNAFTDEGFDSIPFLTHVTWWHYKAVCQSIRSTHDLIQIKFYEENKLYA